MAGQDRDGGALFGNDRKANDRAPDYKGELRLSREVVENLMQQLQRGVQFPAIELAGWKKQASNGSMFISMSGKKPYERNGGGNAGSGGQGAGGGREWPPQNKSPYGSQGGYGGQQPPIDDEIPF